MLEFLILATQSVPSFPMWRGIFVSARINSLSSIRSGAEVSGSNVNTLRAASGEALLPWDQDIEFQPFGNRFSAVSELTKKIGFQTAAVMSLSQLRSVWYRLEGVSLGL